MREYRRTNRKTTSIARRINASFWFKRLFGLFWLDVAILCGITFSFLHVCKDKLPEGTRIPQDIAAIKMIGSGYKNAELYVELIGENDPESDRWRDVEFGVLEEVPEQVDNDDLPESEKKDSVTKDEVEVVRFYTFSVHEFYDYAMIPFEVLVAFEILSLFFALFETGSIRRKLRPLNDLAIQAEQLSKLPLDSTQLDHLEQAILNVSPDAQDSKIQTGDDDLRSIEVALNNLLYRMRESQKQQTRFVSDASHELRTPISVIQGYVNMLDRWGKEDESVLDESIEALKNESEHMKELIEQLLFLARGDSGRNVLKPVDIDLCDVVQEVWEESMMIDENHRYIYKQARTEESEDDGISYMMNGDLAMVKQSIRIFVQNAAKYSEAGNAIKFSVKKDGDKVSYIIQDEGIGMDGEDVVHIFERFYRSDEARNGETGGSGLGLSIAKWIIDAHQGTIDVLSRPEMGTRFTVTFPVGEVGESPNNVAV